MNFKKFLLEEPLLPHHEKEFTKLGQDTDYKKKYVSIFGDRDRIYLPISTKDVKLKLDKFLNSELKRFFSILGTKTLASLPNYNLIEVKKSFKNNKVKYIFRNIKTNENIEKDFDMLEEFKKFLKEKYGNDKEEIDKIYNMLKYSAYRFNKPKKLMVMISRNPCDIGGMSTNKGWKSCMNLYDGMYNSKVRDDVREGTLVAYLIDAEDINADHPLGRKLLKPYVRGASTSKKMPDKYLVLTDAVYGLWTDEATTKIKEWLNINQKKITGEYTRNPNLYNDHDVETRLAQHIKSLKVGDRVELLNSGDYGFWNDDDESIFGKVIEVISKWKYKINVQRHQRGGNTSNREITAKAEDLKKV